MLLDGFEEKTKKSKRADGASIRAFDGARAEGSGLAGQHHGHAAVGGVVG